MDKKLSVRVDEATVRRITSLARRLDTSKKRVIEDAVEAYAARIEGEQKEDVFKQTLGAWRRKEPPSRTVERIRAAFRREWRHR